MRPMCTGIPCALIIIYNSISILAQDTSMKLLPAFLLVLAPLVTHAVSDGTPPNNAPSRVPVTPPTWTARRAPESTPVSGYPPVAPLSLAPPPPQDPVEAWVQALQHQVQVVQQQLQALQAQQALQQSLVVARHQELATSLGRITSQASSLMSSSSAAPWPRSAAGHATASSSTSSPPSQFNPLCRGLCRSLELCNGDVRVMKQIFAAWLPAHEPAIDDGDAPRLEPSSDDEPRPKRKRRRSADHGP